MLNIDPSKVTPVPKEDVERLRMAIRERVIKPMLARSLQRAIDEREARLRPILPQWPHAKRRAQPHESA
jgi:hypothetical protein